MVAYSCDVCARAKLSLVVAWSARGQHVCVSVEEIGLVCCECECIYCSWGVVRYSRERSCLVAFRDGHRDNDDATSDSITCSYVLMYVLVTGVRLGVLLWCRLLFEPLGTVTFVTTVTICCDDNVDAW